MKRLFLGDNWHWVAEEERTKEFLGHVRVASFIQSDLPTSPSSKGSSKNRCVVFSDEVRTASADPEREGFVPAAGVGSG